MTDMFPVRFKGQSGFSLVEIMLVFTLIIILGSTASFYLSGHKKLYKPDDQTRLIVDLLQEARQRSLTQRVTFRVEIDQTENHVRLINEKEPDTADDDEVLKILPLYFPNEVRMDRRPENILQNPPEAFPVPTTVFVPSVYPSSTTHQVCTMRFMSNGTVTNAGNNAIGDGAIVGGATIHVWQPSSDNQDVSSFARALTIIGSTGSVRLWEYDASAPNANKWRDSRRVGSYGGTTQP